MNHFLSTLRSAFVTRYASFRGRSGRGELLLCLFVEFLLFVAWIFLCCTILSDVLSDQDVLWITWALILLLTPPALSVQVRRLHDINWNGFWLWLWLVPVAQVFLWVVLFMRKGTDGPNRYDDARPPRALYRNPVCWGVGVLVCWLAVPVICSILAGRVTPETHFITEPRTPDGQVDYYAAMMDQYKEMFKDPEQNGVRDLLQMFGTRFSAPPTGPCEEYMRKTAALTLEKLQLPQNIEPEFPEFEPFTTAWLEKHLPQLPDGKPDISGLNIHKEDFSPYEEEEGRFEDISTDEKIKFYYYFYLFKPWQEADHPLAAEWLKQNEAVLDRVAAAVRKPCFMDWPSRLQVQHFYEAHYWKNWAEDFVTVFQLRAAYNVGRGQTEKALEDARTIFLFGQHFKKCPLQQLVHDGQTYEWEGIFTLAKIVKSQELSPQELEKEAEILNEIQQANRNSFRPTMERLRYEVFIHLDRNLLLDLGPFCTIEDYFLDERTIRRTFLKFWFEEVENLCSGEKPVRMDPSWWSALEKRKQKYASPWNEPWRLLTGTFFRNWCSRRYAIDFTWDQNAFYNLLDREFAAWVAVNLIRASVELELYKVRNGAYPAKLAELKLPEEVLLDPYSPTRESLKYSLKPQDEQSPQYLLYSIGPNLKDDGGNNDDDWTFGLH